MANAGAPTLVFRALRSGDAAVGSGGVPIQGFELGPGAALGVVSCVRLWWGSPVSLDVLAATSNLIMSLGASPSERTEHLTFTPPMSQGFTFVADAQRLKALAPWHSGYSGIDTSAFQSGNQGVNAAR